MKSGTVLVGRSGVLLKFDFSGAGSISVEIKRFKYILHWDL